MLRASVGNGGKNNKSDVIYIQTLLNNHKFSLSNTSSMPLRTDGVCGKKTISAITAFQAEVVCLSYPDGRVDPGGKTIKSLEKKTGGYSQTPLAAIVGIKVTKPTTATPTSPAKEKTITPITTVKTDPRQLKTRTDVASVYGAITADKKWARQNEFLSAFTVPANIQSHKDYTWINVYSPKKNKVTVIYCHKAMHSFLEKALNNLVSRNLLGDLKEYGGSHCIRATRGTSNWSAHSWALAIDINMTGNELGKTPKMSKDFAKCFTDAGFGWGGNYTRKDGMHFTIAGFDMPRA